jgi:hypothetical protein
VDQKLLKAIGGGRGVRYRLQTKRL